MPPQPERRRSCAAGVAAIAFVCLTLAGTALAAQDDQGDETKPTTETTKPEETRQDKTETAQSGTTKAPSSARTAQPATRAPQFRGPDITLIAGEERNIYEYRQNGQLRMIKVVPKFGRPYYLAPRDPTRGWGDLEQADSLIAEWVLWEF